MIETGNHYNNAPIIEAVIDINADFARKPTKNDFNLILSHFREDYLAPTLVFASKLEVAPNEHNVTVEAESGFLGYRLVNKEKNRVLQVRINGFTYSHLPKYTDWDTFKGEGMPLWNQYVNSLKPQSITRCAVRYINKIEIPSERVEPEEYFKIYPSIPNTLSNQDVSNFNMQIQMPQRDLGAVANITQAILAPSKPQSTAILLDIDVFNQKERSIDDQRNMWKYFDELRNRKNELFEASITDKTREIIS